MNSGNQRAPAETLIRFGNAYIRALTAVVAFSQRFAWGVVIVAVALTVLSVRYTLSNFEISTDTSQVLSRDLPFQQEQNRLSQAFPQLNDTITVVLQGATPALAQDAATRLADWLGRQSVIADVYQPGGGAFFRTNGLLFLDTDQLWDLSNRLSAAQPLISQLTDKPTLPQFLSVLTMGLEQQGKGGPQLGGLDTILSQLGETLAKQEAGRFYQIPWGQIITGRPGGEEDDRRFVIVKPRLDYNVMQPAQDAIDTIRSGIRTLGIDSDRGVQARITGSAALDNEQLSTVSRGTGFATGLSVALVLLLLYIGLRSPRLVFFNLATLAMGLSWTAAFALAITGPLNLISVAFAVLFVGLGVDFGIQFCMRYQEEIEQHGTSREALRRTAIGIGGAISLAALAAAISFYSFVPTSYAGIVDLGLISGTSMFIALAANVTVLPALLTLRPVKLRRRRWRKALPLWRMPIHRFSRIVIVIAGLLAAGTVPFIIGSRFDFNPLHLQSPTGEAVRTFQYLLQNSKLSPYEIEVLEPSLKRADEVAKRLDKLPVVAQTVTLSSYVPANQDEKLDIIQQMQFLFPSFTINPAAPPAPQPAAIRKSLAAFEHSLAAFARRLPGDPLAREARDLQGRIAHYLEVFGEAPERLAGLQTRVMHGLLLQLSDLSAALQAGPVKLGDLPQPLVRRYLSPGGTARIEVMSSLDLSSNVNLRRFVDAVRTITPNAAGTPVMLVEGGDAVVSAFVEASLISVFLISLLLLLALRNFVDALMVLIPLVVAAMFMVAAMSIFGISFNLANIIVLPLLIGLGVAFGIYLVVRWRSGVPIALLLQTSTPEAVLLSAMTTMSSFGSLAVAGDPGMAMLGKTLMLALTAVLLTILLLLPALLMLRTPSPSENEPGMTP